MVNSVPLLHKLSSSLNIITPLGSPSTLELKTNLFKKTIPATLRLRARQAATSSRHATFVYICFAYSLGARRCPILVFVEMLDVHYRVLAFLGSKRFFGNLSPLTIRKPATPIYYIPHGTVPAPLPFAALEFACWACSQKLRLQLCFSHWLRWERS